MAAIVSIIASRSLRSALAGLLGWTLFFGCAAPPGDLEGVWVGTRALGPMPGVPDDVRNTLAKVQLTVRRGGEFELLKDGLVLGGMVRQAGGSTVLSVETLLGRSISEGQAPQSAQRQIRANLLDATSLRLSDPKDGPDAGIILRREAQPVG